MNWFVSLSNNFHNRCHRHEDFITYKYPPKWVSCSGNFPSFHITWWCPNHARIPHLSIKSHFVYSTFLCSVYRTNRYYACAIRGPT